MRGLLGPLLLLAAAGALYGAWRIAVAPPEPAPAEESFLPDPEEAPSAPPFTWSRVEGDRFVMTPDDAGPWEDEAARTRLTKTIDAILGYTVLHLREQFPASRGRWPVLRLATRQRPTAETMRFLRDQKKRCRDHGVELEARLTNPSTAAEPESLLG